MRQSDIKVGKTYGNPAGLNRKVLDISWKNGGPDEPFGEVTYTEWKTKKTIKLSSFARWAKYESTREVKE